MRSPRLRTFLAASALLAACSSSGHVSHGGDDDDDDTSVTPDGGGGGDDDGGGGGDDGGTTTPDGGITTPDGGNTGVTLTVCASGAQFPTIGAALAAASAGDTISVCGGTYGERITVDKAVFLQGAGAATTTINGGGAGTVVTVANTADAGVIIEGFTITGGAGAADGGGVRCDTSTLTLRASTLLSNTAPNGGGMYATGCTLDIHDVTFQSNHVTLGGTGGGALLDHSHGSIHQNVFDGNHAEHGGGLAIVEGDVSAIGNQLANNVAGTQGGGMWVSSDSEIASNVMHDGDGGWTAGGLYVFEHAPLVHDNDIYANHSQNDGGGVYLHMSMATLRANHVHDNVSDDDAGGIRIFESSATIDANIVENNTCVDGGGGIKISHVPSHFTNNIIRGNTCGTGGGVMMDDDASFWDGDQVIGNHASSGGGFWVDMAPWTGAHFHNVLVQGNHGYSGGGFTLWNNFEPIYMDGVTIIGNSATTLGGGIHASGTTYYVTHSLIANNTSHGGGAIYHAPPDPWNHPCPCPQTTTDGFVQFSVLAGNTGTNGGSAVWTAIEGLTVQDSIIYGHAGTVVKANAPLTWRYNDTMPATFSGMTDPAGTEGNLESDPGFVNAGGGDFHLASGSVCVDAADPNMTDGDGTRADMGMFGGAL